MLTLPAAAQITPVVSPLPVRVEGIVEDESGRPIAGARVDHASLRGPELDRDSDSNGHFAVQAEGPAVVIRKPGFESYFLRIAGASPVRIVLKPYIPGPQCVEGAIAGVRILQGRDADYATRSRVLDTKDGPRALVEGEGALWSFGVPNTSDVWSSVKYLEHVETERGAGGDVWVVDARGKTREGKYWRYRGKLGHSTTYRDADQVTAALMDRLIGGHCPPF